jgi:integrase
MQQSSFPPELQKFVDSVEENAQAAGKSAPTARIFGAWSACFVRFCTVNDRSWRDTKHVSAFLSYLENRKDVDASSRRRAAQALVFLFEDLLKADVSDADWHPDRHQAEASDEPASDAENSDEASDATAEKPDEGEQSTLLTKILFHTSLPISEAMELCAGDVDLDAGLIYVSDAMGTPKQIVELPDVLHAPLEDHLERLRKEHGPRFYDAPLFQARALKGRVDEKEPVHEAEQATGQEAEAMAEDDSASTHESEPVPAESAEDQDPSERPPSLWGYAEDE